MEDKPTPTSFLLTAEERRLTDQLAAELGLAGRSGVVRFLLHAYKDGLLMIMNKDAKQTLVGAAEERMLALAKRVAREETMHVLWEEGFRSTPYAY